MPERIQLRRTKGWRKPEAATVVSRPSRWGNPYKVEFAFGGWSVDEWRNGKIAQHLAVYEDRRDAQQEAVRRFRIYAELNPGFFSPLAGCDLACWCPLDQRCHADVLLDIANRTETTP